MLILLSPVTFFNILYIVYTIAVIKVLANTRITISSSAKNFKNKLLSIGKKGVVIVLISLYGINPLAIFLATL